MLIQNITGAASAPKFTNDSVPSPVAAPKAESVPVELPTSAKVAPEQQADQPKVATPVTLAELQNAVDSINKAMKQVNSSLEFSIDHDTNKTVIKVVESGTGQVIRQYPSEEVLAISRAIDQKMQQQGLLLKQKA